MKTFMLKSKLILLYIANNNIYSNNEYPPKY